ncbi:MAG: SufE family protein [Fimbriimonadaceae bacterium]|nr:SufE family protein [Fimbriimonadaceae bacterium]
MPYPARLQEFVDNLALFADQAERVQVLISFAEKFQPVSAEVATKPYLESHRVPGCESEAFVWVTPSEGGGVSLHFDVLNPQGISAMAMAVILKENLDGLSPTEIGTVTEDLVYDVFGRTLSMGKNMGLMGMVRMTKYLAAHANDTP